MQNTHARTHSWTWLDQWPTCSSHTHTHTHAYTHTRARYGVMMKLHQHSPTPTFPHTVTLYSSSGTPMVETESRYFRDNHTLHILKKKTKPHRSCIFAQGWSPEQWPGAGRGWPCVLILLQLFSFYREKLSTLKANCSRSVSPPGTEP